MTVPVPWCPVCGRNHSTSQCWQTPADDTPPEQPANLIPADLVAGFDDLPSAWVDCEQGENGCTGGDLTDFMVHCENGSWVCRTCDEIARAEHEQDMRDRNREYWGSIFGY